MIKGEVNSFVLYNDFIGLLLLLNISLIIFDFMKEDSNFLSTLVFDISFSKLYSTQIAYWKVIPKVSVFIKFFFKG